VQQQSLGITASHCVHDRGTIPRPQLSWWWLIPHVQRQSNLANGGIKTLLFFYKKKKKRKKKAIFDITALGIH
jgi:hypothetical protein